MTSEALLVVGMAAATLFVTVLLVEGARGLILVYACWIVVLAIHLLTRPP
jgi:hypothetical protein